MTFSIVAGGGTAYGVAVASKFLAVGSVVPAAVPGIGAVATQSFAKVSYKADSLALLRAGASASDVVARITDADPLRETRQVGVVGDGGAATFTGADCSDWAGGATGGVGDGEEAGCGCDGGDPSLAALGLLVIPLARRRRG